jgi:GWxTD domain-containing protein
MRDWVLALAALPLVTGAGAGQTRDDVDLTVARFYRDGGITLVDAFCRVPFSLVEPLSEGADGFGAYEMAVDVRDSTGLLLHEDQWSQRVPVAVLRVQGTSSVEQFTFAAQPGRYTIEVAVRDSASGRLLRRNAEVQAYEEPPMASDLLLALGIRRAGGGDTIAGPGEIRKGTLFLSSAARPALTPRRASLFYYLELYAGEAVTATLEPRVLGADDAQLIAGPSLEMDVASGGGVATGGLNLEGLPPGEYRLDVVARLGDRELQREAEFTMAGFDTEAALAQTATEETSRFAHSTEAQLDSMYAPLIHIQEASERGVYDGLSVEGKRSYLERFWARRDPTPGTVANEAADDYYALVAEANRRFREGGRAATPGWRTDRGRILIRHGEPTLLLREPVPEGQYPWEVWRYATGRGFKYLFVDETGFGNWALVYTDDLREPSRAGWEGLFHDDDLERVVNF